MHGYKAGRASWPANYRVELRKRCTSKSTRNRRWQDNHKRHGLSLVKDSREAQSTLGNLPSLPGAPSDDATLSSERRQQRLSKRVRLQRPGCQQSRSPSAPKPPRFQVVPISEQDHQPQSRHAVTEPPYSLMEDLGEIPVSTCPTTQAYMWVSPDGERTGAVRNIRLDGMFIQCATPAEVGSTVRLRLMLPDGEAHDVDCVFRFTISSGVGVEFMKVTHDMESAIQQLFATSAHPMLSGKTSR